MTSPNPAPTSPVQRDPGAASSRRRGVLLLVGGGLAVLLLGAAATWLFFFAGEPPAAASIDGATGVVTGSPTPSSAATGSPAPSADPSDPSADPSAGEEPTAGSSAETDGTWVIDASIGSPDDGTSAYVGFRVAEELQGIGATEAVGRTTGVSGSLTLEGSTLQAATIDADLTALQSDRERRDPAIQRTLQTGQYPTATFTLAVPVDLGAIPADGETVSVTAPGTLSLHGVDVDLDVPLQARLVDDVIVVVGSVPVTFTDWGISMPTAPIVLSVNESGTLELQLFFTRS
jgi:polyisoprenoid-binding protein YceI